MKENKFLKQVKEVLAYLSGDPDFQRLVESRAGMLMDIDCYKEQCRQEALIEGRAKGHAEGRAEGRAESKNEKAKEIAKKEPAPIFEKTEPTPNYDLLSICNFF